MDTIKSKCYQIIMTGLNECMRLYFENGPRSSKKTDHLNNMIIDYLSVYFSNLHNIDDYSLITEHNLQCANFSEQKKCDIVVCYKNAPYIVFPLKFVMTSYLKNRNNYFENITGEVYLLKQSNPDLKIVPINFILDKIPNLTNDKKIKNFELITHENSFNVYSTLIKSGIIYDIYNVVIKTEHSCQIGDKYDQPPLITDIIENKSLYDIINGL